MSHHPQTTSPAPSAPSHVHPDAVPVVTIDTPQDNSNVPGGGTFTTYGFCENNSGTTKSARVKQGTTTWNGTAAPVKPNHPPYQWAFQFTGLPLNTPLQLTVSATNSDGTGSRTITITCVS